MRKIKKKLLFFLPLLGALVLGISVHAFTLPKEPILMIDSEMHSGVLTNMATDAQNRYLVTGSEDKTVRVWDLSGGRLSGVLRPPAGKGKAGMIYGVAISPDGATVACGGNTIAADDTYNIYFFDRESGRLIKRISGLTDSVSYLKFSRDGRVLAAGLWRGGGLRIYSVDRDGFALNYSLVKEDRDVRGHIWGLDFDPGGRLVVASGGGSVRLYDKDFILIVAKTAPGGRAPYRVGFAPDGSKVALGYNDVARVDILSGSDLSLLRTATVVPSRSEPSHLESVTWSQDGRSLYAGGHYYQEKGNVILKWSNADITSPQYLPVPRSFVNAILPLRDGGIAYAGGKGEMGLFDKDGKERWVRRPDLTYFTGKTFLISSDGVTVQFNYEQDGGVPARFSVESKQLELRRTSGRDLNAPIMTSKEIRISDWHYRADPKLNDVPLKLRESADVTCYAISPDHATFVLGTRWHLYLFDRSGTEMWHQPLKSVPRAVNISSDGRLVVAGLSDGTIRWYRMKDGKELLAFYPHVDRKRWVLWTPSGYYDASEGGDNLIGWHVNNGFDQEASFYPVSRFFERFYRPEVMVPVIRSLKGDAAVIAALGEKTAPDLESGIKKPPRVAILSPLPGKQFDSEEQEVKIIAEDLGGGIDDVHLYHNGKILPPDAGTKVTKKGTAQEHLYLVRLIEGPNQLRASALSVDRIESSPMEITVTLRGAERESDLHLVIIAINHYKNAALNLTYAEPDARSIKDFFESDGVRKLFKNINVYSLVNEQATRENIKRLFDDVEKKAQSRDTYLVYFAGHGDTVGDEWYFIPYDVVSPEIESDLKKGGVSHGLISEAIRGCKAQKVFVMIDSCKSGKMVLAMRSMEARKALVQLARSTGTYIISASTDRQYAAEIQSLGHGVFTYTLLEGLKGTGGDKKVTVEGLIQYVKNKLPDLTEKYRGEAQYPISWGTGMDFPIVLY